MNRFNLGLLAEYLTIFFYKLTFHHILHHRMRNYGGEIDIVALRAKQLVFIEVKARKTIINDQILLEKQQQRIKKAAEIFLMRNRKYENYNVRFDLVIIRPYKLPMIIKNAW